MEVSSCFGGSPVIHLIGDARTATPFGQHRFTTASGRYHGLDANGPGAAGSLAQFEKVLHGVLSCDLK